jgi:hypothetical protein
MATTITRFLVPIATAALSALGGAMMVFSAFDDAPGGSLIGLLLIVGAAAFSVRRELRH